MLRRLLSPGGFALVALCFLLPFLTVSCQADGHRGSGTYQGIDLVYGGPPDITMDGLSPDNLPEVMRSKEEPDQPAPLDPQPFAIASLLLVLAGAATALLRTAWSRALGGLACAAVAVMFLAGAQTILRSELRDALDRGGVRSAPGVDVAITDRYGFWLTVSVLIAVAALNLLQLITESRQPSGAGQSPVTPRVSPP